jgi:uncharacterized protein YkuJ
MIFRLRNGSEKIKQDNNEKKMIEFGKNGVIILSLDYYLSNLSLNVV